MLFRVWERGDYLIREKVPLVSSLIDQIRDHRLCHHFQTTRGLDMTRLEVGVARTASKNPPLTSGGLDVTGLWVDGDQCGLALSAHSVLTARKMIADGLVYRRSLTELCPYFKRLAVGRCQSQSQRLGAPG